MANIKQVNPVQTLKIFAGDTIQLSVIVKDYIASSVVKFRNASNNFPEGEINDLLIGKANDINGKTLRVVTRVILPSDAKKIFVTDQFENTDPNKFVHTEEVTAAPGFFTVVSDYKFEI